MVSGAPSARGKRTRRPRRPPPSGNASTRPRALCSGRHEVGLHASPAQGIGGRRPDRGHQRRAEGPGVAQRGHEAVHRVRRREDDPVAGPRTAGGRGPQGGPAVGRVDLAGQRELQHRRPGPLERVDQAARPATRAGHHHRAARQRPGAAGAGCPPSAGHRADDDDAPAAPARPRPGPPAWCAPSAGGVVPRSTTSDRRVGRPAAGDERVGDVGPGRHAHQDHQRPARPGQGRPVRARRRRRRRRRGPLTTVTDDDHAPMGDRDPDGGRDAERRRHARDHLAGDAGRAERLGLLPATPEDEGVAAFEADHDGCRAGRARRAGSSISSWWAAPARLGILAHVDQRGAAAAPGRAPPD